MTNFTAIFGIVLVVNVLVTFRSSDYWKKLTQRGQAIPTTEDESLNNAQSAAWQALLRKYLLVYLLATLSDWLQGPYVYALYADYGFSQHDIAVLFVAGFGSSMVFGSFIGGMADWGGRRAFVIVFALVYAASCVTKHFKHYWILMLGRLLGGVATSLLFSIFEAWLIRSHADAGLKSYLGRSFSWAAYGNSIIAIAAGLLANKAANAFKMQPVAESYALYIGGFLNPFDIALVALVLCGFFAATTWEENYGDSDHSSADASRGEDNARQPKWYDGLRSAFVTTARSTDILLCGLVSSLFEGSMYIFVFMWTPALTTAQAKTDGEGKDEGLPFGLIFSTFMVCCMLGSSVFSIQIQTTKVECLAVSIMGTAAVAMGLVALSSSQTMKFLAMNLFEVTVGMYWPVMGTLKGSIVPESKRAAIYNLFRIPLNFIVLFSLLTDLTPTQSFFLNACMLASATVMQVLLMKRREKTGQTGGSGSPSPDTSKSGDKKGTMETVQLVDSNKKEVMDV